MNATERQNLNLSPSGHQPFHSSSTPSISKETLDDALKAFQQEEERKFGKPKHNVYPQILDNAVMEDSYEEEYP